ncbi:PREDICTED: ribonuclease 3-like protein 3 [Camelina sativa]|uniref:Ribonuclease 3-like protein 3 n=1 Tax=Camelina sativa TaxID=90675 RepID=A0ABM0V697_CAMSA|nr:PREDICTED: ribonuclease 3-like protein 3 [Camelina sativa]
MESQLTNAVAESFPQPHELDNLTSFEGNEDNNTEAKGSTDPADEPLDIELLEKNLNYKFKNKNLLLQAFTDATYVDEECDSYELLELLGDSVLDTAIIFEFIKLYPKQSPGVLTKLRAVNVDSEKLARVAVKHELYRYLRHKKPLFLEQIMEFVEAKKEHPLHSHGLLKVPKSLANIVESTIGALFMDCECIKTVWKVIKPFMEPIILLENFKNHPMTELNEMCQKKNLKLTSKDTWEINGKYCFLIEDKLVGCGLYPEKKETARNRAAQNAVENFSKFFEDL